MARFVSAPYAQQAKLILKVSLNLGANLSLTNFGLTYGQRTLHGALTVERRTLIRQIGLRPRDFSFPTNGSGSPDSKATPRAIVKLLTVMSHTRVARPFHQALPVLGVDGSLALTGRQLPARGHVFAKTGTTIQDGQLNAEVVAGYIDARSGRKYAFAVFVNHYGPIKAIEDVIKVLDDEAAIADNVYETG